MLTCQDCRITLDSQQSNPSICDYHARQKRTPLLVTHHSGGYPGFVDKSGGTGARRSPVEIHPGRDKLTLMWPAFAARAYEGLNLNQVRTNIASDEFIEGAEAVKRTLLGAVWGMILYLLIYSITVAILGSTAAESWRPAIALVAATLAAAGSWKGWLPGTKFEGSERD